MSGDARRTSHPIHQPVVNESEATAAFDYITYIKGQALLRLLEDYLGEDAFAAGIRVYMREHAFSNATTVDLWHALDAASGKAVTAIASAHTEPARRAARGRAGNLSGWCPAHRVATRTFAIHDPAPVTQHWQVPVASYSIS
jgi:aminopeptidase N